jgi:hypothetical protein
MRAVDAIATIRDYSGRRHFLHMEKDFLTSHKSRWLLPVVFVHCDPRTGAVLIEFPRAEDVIGSSKVTA